MEGKHGMLLWTMQPVEVYDALKKNGVYRCDITKSDYASYEQFTDAYDWMKEQLTDRCGNPKHIKDMVWAWHTYDGKHKKPDLRHTGFGKKGEKEVCLEIDIPDNEVLLSDFDEWHNVLNRWFCDNSQNEEEWEHIQEELDNLPGDVRDKKIRESWQRIFDIKQYKTDWRSNGYYVQAVFWELKLEQIKKVQYFTAR